MTIIRGILGVCLIGGLTRIGYSETQTNTPDWPFFAFDNGVGRDVGWQPDQQATILANLNYDGIGYSGLGNVEQRLTAFEKQDLKVFSFYVPCSLEEPQPLDATTLENLPKLKGTGAILWLLVTGTATEEQAVIRLRTVADLANSHGVKVALYPHDNTYIETGEHALRLVKLVKRGNFGLSINTCHELKAGTGENLAQLVTDSIDHLYLVSINGADRLENPDKEKNWIRLIQPLDQGTFDLKPFLRQLRDSGYKGPIGLQCYLIPGEIETLLERSHTAWAELLARISAD